MYAEIIIPAALPKNYTWSVPEQFREAVKPGCRVEVNLGKRKRYAGIIKTIGEKKPASFETKDILNVLDVEPVIFPEQLKLWEWMASYYMCSEGEVMAAALPAHFKLSSETVLVFNEEYGDNFSSLEHDEFIVAEALLIKKELKLTEVQEILDSSNVYPVINQLIQQKLCFVWESLKQTYKPKKEMYVLLNPAFNDEKKLEDLLNNWSRAPKQMELLLSYLHFQKTEGEVVKSKLLKKSGASDAQLKGLIEKNILQVEKRNVDRILYLPKNVDIDFTLTTQQQEALKKILQQLEEKPVCLLHGITSSGKTNIYIELIATFIKAGKQVLFMLPEIALTAQIIRRLQKHFGGYIGIYHSKFSQNERVEIWEKVKTGQLSVILGARSSLFLPYQNLGLIICDEEHDTSYKQFEPAPRYSGRDAAIYYAGLFNARVLLGSGTPSIESYFNATQGKYGFVELKQRFGDMRLPPIEIIDTGKIVQKDKQCIMLSPPLIDEIQSVINKGKQVILFQNRRGYTPYQVCNVCGWIPKCKFCDVSLTFHKFNNKLLCHYCGTIYSPVHSCAACGSDQFVQRNFGTEKIEEQLQEVFPDAHIARMDMDTVRGKNAHDVLIQRFEQHKIDILVGTQMVVKGLDFDHVDLVGILDADALMQFADFRVNERAFQLMEQVSGRAGRKNEKGKVVIQTLQPEHPLLQMVQQHDYQQMFTAELANRNEFGYPPLTKLIKLTFRHRQKPIVVQAAMVYAEALKKKYGKNIVGPAEPVIGRVRNLYLMELLVKMPRDNKVITRCKKDLQEQIALLHQQKNFRSVMVIADVDPI
ncbi:MAG: primosomal protein N' [Chitinophagaceae bacterium]|nr:primosomal protein N' [Chitinophagaceae bacterium]